MQTNEQFKECQCGIVHLGSEVTKSRNWNPICKAHGTTSQWYNSPEQISRRMGGSRKLKQLQALASLARRSEIGCNHRIVEDDSEIKLQPGCPLCDLYVEEAMSREKPSVSFHIGDYCSSCDCGPTEPVEETNEWPSLRSRVSELERGAVKDK